MSVVDASVWVSRLLPQDVHHSASMSWLKQQTAQAERLVVPVLALVEVSGAIAHRTGKPELAHRAIRQLLRIPTLHIVATDYQLGMAATRVAADLQLRGADAVYVALAHELAVPLVSWDKEQRERARQLITVLSP